MYKFNIRKLNLVLLLIVILLFGFIFFQNSQFINELIGMVLIFWVSNWVNIISSISSISTVILVWFTLNDFRKRYQFEQRKLKFESDPCILISAVNPLFMQRDYDHFVNEPKTSNDNYTHYYINKSKFKFNFNNYGRSSAKNINLSVSNNIQLKEFETLKDYHKELPLGTSGAHFSIEYLPVIQKDAVDWEKDFYVKCDYENNYTNEKLVNFSKAVVKTLKIPNHPEKTIISYSYIDNIIIL